MNWFTLLLLSLAAYRAGRFISLDSLIEGTRDKVAFWLHGRDGMWASKLLDLLGCPWCITIWTGLGATLFWGALLTDWPGWWFPVYWLAVSTVAVVIWTVVDSA